VSFKDLTEKPRPPRLDGALRRNYPAGARLAGRAGTARVLLSVTSSGKVTGVRLVKATDPEFGEACRRTLLGTTWSAPLDQQGRAVGTLMPYECRFRVTP
jgi:TonB family protein